MSVERDLIEGTADYCLIQLRREVELLEQCQQALSAVRQALREGPSDGLMSAIDLQQQSERLLSANQAERTRLVNRLAIALDVPASQATIGRLLLRLPRGDQESQLQSLRRRARNAAKQVERLCRGNASLIAHRLELMRRLLNALGAAQTETYEASGEMQPPADAPSMINRAC